ncbi:COMM domain-containing protein 4 [Toxocara canis]|uniref:COMM domain-containing protein 4 n=1 Tax=Toxocara canis TaxID=6265 RepID=A0A0B2VZK8_TOXCA|nr:COMM domain-containing protein 4 [Toxocara canis]
MEISARKNAAKDLFCTPQESYVFTMNRIFGAFFRLRLDSVIKFKGWCSYCVSNLIAKRAETSAQQIASLNSDGAIGDDSLKAMLAALSFIFEKSVKSACSPHDLEMEMQQLGLPAEHCKQLIKIYTVNFEKLKTVLTSSFMRGPSLSITSQSVKNIDTDKVYVLNLRASDGEQITIAVNDEKLHFLQRELSEALDITRTYVKSSASAP